MYQFSRAHLPGVAPHIVAPKPGVPPTPTTSMSCRACEAVVERMAIDRHYFARPERTLFCDIRSRFR